MARWTEVSKSSIPDRGKRFFALPYIRTGSGTHPTSYTMGTTAASLGVKGQGCEADHPSLLISRLSVY
jgi:hypothetical protein